jgi:4,5:9,10-diseco-3-hydroxy-5,9,17-trioxoandrosta-1(10),2-diene-4-oate hydrolase
MSIQAVQDQYMQVGQIRTRFWTVGDEETIVVLIHGIGSSMEYWIHNIHTLAKHHRVYAMDLVGNGRSDKPAAPYSFPYFAQFVNDFLQAQNIDRVSLIGNSMGGGVALQFTLQFPDKVEKLVLVDSAGLGREVSLFFRLPTLPLVGKWLTRPRREGTAQLMREAFYDPALITDELVDFNYQMSTLPGAQGAILSTLRRNITLRGVQDHIWRAIVDNLHNITAPTLVIWGQQDRILPVAHAQVARDRIANVRLHLIDHCGHMPQMERPEEFNAVVLEFLASS